MLDPLAVCINEFMADNDSALDVDGAFPDWIELYNPTAESILLDGWWLSDDRDEPDKHELEGGLTLEPLSGLVLYADGAPELGPEHLAFSLEVEGEEIVLTAPDGRASIVAYGPLTGDVTAAREIDCCVEPECWVYRFSGSPGDTNGLPEVVELPLLEPGDTWRVFDAGTDAPAGWTEPGFDDSGWWSGVAPLGYGDVHIVTEVSYGPNPNAKFTTTYFRTTFEAAAVEDLDEVLVGVLRDDGAAVYINGIEVGRSNLPAGPLSYATAATVAVGDADETAFQPFTIPFEDVTSILVNGTNTLAVEVHQAAPTSSDQGMDAAVTGEQWVAPAPADPPEGEYELLIEDVPGLADPSAFLFTRDVIHSIELEIPPSSWDALTVDPYTYQPATVRIEGEVDALVGVRLRGKYGSFRDLGGKPKFKIDFNRFVDNQRFFGLESLSLNNSIVDCSYVKELVSYQVFREAGLPTPRLAFTDVSVNGMDYGLYQVVESEDDVWLSRNWADGTGNLYDGKYAYEWPWIWVGFVDFWHGMDYLFQLEEGTDVGLADIRSITDVNEYSGGAPSYYADMGAYLDWDHFHRHIAAEQWSGHIDGYWLNTNNYRIYFDPADGLADFVVWDLDYSMLYDWEWGMNFDYPPSAISSLCRNDATCWAAQRAAAQDLVATIDTAALEAEFDAARALITSRATSDPRSECGAGSVTSGQNQVRSWIVNRNAEVSAYWGF